ncbi:MAG: ABC transporter substrate-binding protein [Chlorobiaceae bacterium]|nr:ABC transporter substrate-binding protein [Chlorobiaceae bacterium]
MNNKVKILIPALLAILIGGSWWFAARKEVTKTADVVIREIQTTAPTNWELANKLSGHDILAEEGVRIEPVTAISGSGGTIALQALLAGNIDVGGSAWPAFINIIARGGKIKAVIPWHVSTRNNEGGTQGLVVLDSSSIHTIKDLAGKRIGVNVLGAEADYVIRKYLKKNGIPYSQVELVILPVDKQEQMLRKGQIDAMSSGGIGGPNYEMALENGGVRQIPGTTNYDTKGEAVLSAIGFRNDFIEKHPDAVRRYVRAYDRSRRIIYEAFQKDPGRVRNAYAEVSIKRGANPALAKFFRATSWTPDFPLIVDKDLQWWFDRFAEDGILGAGQLKPSDIYTNEFNPSYIKQ